MTFKQLINKIHDMRNTSQIDGIFADIDKSFEDGKISYDDHELIYNIACWVYKGKKDGSYVRLLD